MHKRPPSCQSPPQQMSPKAAEQLARLVHLRSSELGDASRLSAVLAEDLKHAPDGTDSQREEEAHTSQEAVKAWISEVWCM
jgi:hypothetical protein